MVFNLGACSNSSFESKTETSANQTKETSVTIAETSVNYLKTIPLNPGPINIKIEDLPQPFATNSASKPPQVIPIPSNPVLQVPTGFKINVFAKNLDNPRWLALTPDGKVLVTETRQNRIRLLTDQNQDGVADSITTFADANNGLDIPFGMTFTENYFFLGNHNSVRRYNYKLGQEKLTDQGAKITDLPGGGYRQHWTRNVIVNPEQNKLYVSIGSRSNVDIEALPRASVQVMNLDGSQRQTFADGLRNPVGLAFHPLTKELYTTVNERDALGDDLVPDYFTRIRQGEFYGWPYTYLKSNLLEPRQTQNGVSINPELATKTKTPDVLFKAHSAPLGLQFYTGKTFPEKYQNGAFVAMRGSWNRNQGTGYKIVFIPFNQQGQAQGYYEDFITGFLVDPKVPSTWGRPVGLLILNDGSLLFTEEANGVIYRVQYENN